MVANTPADTLIRKREVLPVVEVVGWVAVVLTQVFWLPNIARLIRTKDVAGHSLIAWVVMTAGLSAWLIYFVAKGDPVGIVANISGVTGAAFTTACILRWRGSTRVLKERASGGMETDRVDLVSSEL
jgi:MtN3 and saliva related transmembrane protein